jgi:flagellar L-ring protein FlgH
MNKGLPAACAAIALLTLAPRAVLGADLFVPGKTRSLATDRVARKVGDSITILVVESAAASNRVSGATSRSTGLSSDIASPATAARQVEFGLRGEADNSGQTERSGRMVAQVSVVVVEVLPNGDLRVFGSQELRVSGERTEITVRGRLRPADVSTDNTVLSSRLAEAVIEYDGSGHINASGEPSALQRFLGWFGLL